MIFEAFARRLRGRDSWRREQEHVAKLVVERPQDTIAFAGVLDLELERRGYDLAVSAVRSSLLDLVCALVHDDATHLAVHLASQPGFPHPEAPGARDERSRGAMQVAGTRPASQIWQVLADTDGLRTRDPEFGLLLLHELVVRAEPVPSAARWFVEWSIETGHPLAQLPTKLLPIEAGLPAWLPHFGPAAGVRLLPFPDPPPAVPVTLGDVLNGLGPTLPVHRDRIGAPFRDWIEHSNGRVEIAAHAPGTTFPYGSPPRLHRLLTVAKISPATAVDALFSNAKVGGAYASGPGGAHARLRTWEAIAGIVGHDGPLALAQLAVAADRTHWIRAEPDDPWFENVAWDLWLIGATSERIVVVAATDTD